MSSEVTAGESRRCGAGRLYLALVTVGTGGTRDEVQSEETSARATKALWLTELGNRQCKSRTSHQAADTALIICTHDMMNRVCTARWPTIRLTIASARIPLVYLTSPLGGIIWGCITRANNMSGMPV